MRKKINSSKTPKTRRRAPAQPEPARTDGEALATMRTGTIAHVIGAAARGDGWQNVLTGIGVSQRDKSTGSTFEPDTLVQRELENIWRGDDMAARIIETPPNEMLREGFELKIQPEESAAPTMPAGASAGADVEPADDDTDADVDVEPVDESEPAPAGTSPKEKPDFAFAKKRKDGFPFGGKSPGGAQGTPPGKNATQGPPGAFNGPPAIPMPPQAPPGIVKPKDDDAKKQAELMIAKFEDLGLHEKLSDALRYERAFGGAGIFIGADDGLDMREPLDLESVKSVNWLTVLSAYELYPVKYYSDIKSPKYGEPEIYRIQPSTYIADVDISAGAGTSPKPKDAAKDVRFAEVHESRFLLFKGIRTSRAQVLANIAPGWGDSVLVRINRVLADFHLAWGSAAILLSDFAQAVFKVKDLAQLIATDRDDVVIKRAQLIDMMRSTARAVLLDSEEEFERKSTSLAGFHEMLEQLALRLAAAASMPVSLLMGQAPAGLNATGDSDIRFFYDGIKSRQKTDLKPRLERLCLIVFRSKDGPTKGEEPSNWSVEFNPLWQATEKELAEIRQLQATTDKTYIDAGVVTPEEIAASRFSGDKYSVETVLDFEAREQGAVEHEQALAVHEQEKAALAKPGAKNAPPAPVPPQPGKPPMPPKGANGPA